MGDFSILSNSRPSWDHFHMNFAWAASLRSTCRVQVGAAVARNNRLLLTGYAGSPPGQPHCTDVGCDWYWRAPNIHLTVDQSTVDVAGHPTKHCKRTIHAERNIVALGGKEGIHLDAATYYTYPFAPCDDCAVLLISAGAKRVVYPPAPDGWGHYAESPLLTASGIETHVLTDWRPPVAA